jgi:serine/threonine protein kinase
MQAFTESLRDRYVLERELGRGGMAVVYLARDVKHDRPVALKVMNPDAGLSLGAERFQREIRLAASLQHPHVLAVHDSGETAGRLWFTMPYVRGESLRDRLRRDGTLPIQEAIRITLEAAQALAHAHKQRIVHRDVKPENILLTEDGATLVADFGIARALDGPHEQELTVTGVIVGTPKYMPPEQMTGGGDARIDQYSLAETCFEIMILRAYGLALAGRSKEAIGEAGQAMTHERQLGLRNPYLPFIFARIYVLANQPEPAIDQLEETLRRRDFYSRDWMRIDGTFAPLRTNPRFQRLVQQ